MLFRSHAWYVGKLTDSKGLKPYIKGACKDAGIQVPELSWPLVLRYALDDDGNRYMFLMNYSSESMTVPSPGSGENLHTGEQVISGDMITLKDWDVYILKAKDENSSFIDG